MEKQCALFCTLNFTNYIYMSETLTSVSVCSSQSKAE